MAQTLNGPKAVSGWRANAGYVVWLGGTFVLGTGVVQLADAFPMLWWIIVGYAIRLAGLRLQGETRCW